MYLIPFKDIAIAFGIFSQDFMIKFLEIPTTERISSKAFFASVSELKLFPLNAIHNSSAVLELSA